jgi:uncharacterized protein (TIGR00725 family)
MIEAELCQFYSDRGNPYGSLWRRKMMKKMAIGIMGPGEGASEQQQQLAWELGKHIAQAGWVLLTGGRCVGVMEAASRGAKQADGLVVGILPGTDDRGMSDAVDIAIFTGMGNARNAINVLSVDVVVACGMGLGTASEVALALKANKPVILLGCDDLSQAFFSQLAPTRVSIAQTVEEAMNAIATALEIRSKLG